MPLTRSSTIITATVAAILVLSMTTAAWAQGPEDGFLITDDRVGDAVVGSTAAELGEQLGSGFDIGDRVPITVDFEGHIVTRDGETQFRAALADGSERLRLFIVSNASYQTAEGVGPLTLISDAEARYGDAMLSWDPDDESREFVTFADQPYERLAFRTPGIGGNNVGIYDEGAFETGEYEEGAVIASVWLSCDPGTDCPADLATGDPDDPDGTGDPDDPDGTGDPDDPDGTGDPDDGPLPETGFEQDVLLVAVAALTLVGGALLSIESRLRLAPRRVDGRSADGVLRNGT